MPLSGREEMKFIITVSPIPLQATGEEQDVVVVRLLVRA
jgi:hypothetical protein